MNSTEDKKDGGKEPEGSLENMDKACRKRKEKKKKKIASIAVVGPADCLSKTVVCGQRIHKPCFSNDHQDSQTALYSVPGC